MNVQVCFCLVVMHCCNAVYSVSSSKQLSKIFQYPLFVHVTEWFRQCNNKSQQMVNVNVPTVFLRHAQLDSALLLLTDGWRRIRPKKKKLPEIHKCISGSFFLFSLAWLVAYSISWAERFIWLFLGTFLCILFFIFILFRIFVYLV